MVNNQKREKESTAFLYGFRISARKARVIASQIRGKNVGLAITSLFFQKKSSAKPIQLLLKSAVANAEGIGLDIDKLIISEILVDKGPIIKRFMSRAHGKTTRIRKQTAHIKIRLKELK